MYCDAIDHTQTFLSPGNIIMKKQSQVDNLFKNWNNRRLFLFNFEMRFF